MSSLRGILRQRKSLILCTCVGLGAALASPVVVAEYASGLSTQQLMLERMRVQELDQPATYALRLLAGSYSVGMSLIVGALEPSDPDLENPLEVLEYVERRLPTRMRAYPTEGYYYFEGRIADRAIRGSLRLADFIEGRITLSYFTTDDQPSIEHSMCISNGGGHGVEIESIGDRRLKLTMGGREHEVTLERSSARPPQASELLPNEQFITSVADESGVDFWLIYNPRYLSLYYVVPTAALISGRTERLADGLLLDGRTGFAYVLDEQRARGILVGVSFEEIKGNTFFDGPGDQVPFELECSELLAQAYPHVLSEPGISKTGVMLGDGPWRRVAIAPYHRYHSLTELEERAFRMASCNDPELGIVAATKEWWNNDRWIGSVESRLQEQGQADLPQIARHREVLQELEQLEDTRSAILGPNPSGLGAIHVAASEWPTGTSTLVDNRRHVR